MPRLRLGVALLVPRSVAGEIDVLRRACGDEAVERMAPHLTLVPPVNVREDRLDDALARLRGAAAATRPLTLTLGPPTTFLPANPVLYLAVGGETEALHALRDRVFVEPLARPLTWPFRPHVTVVDGGEPERLHAAVTALAGYRTEVSFERVHLLQERRDDAGVRVWRPIADAAFEDAAIVGRGGLELELAVSEQLDPDAQSFRGREWTMVDPDRRGDARSGDLAVTARRAERVVGTARGWTSGSCAHLGDLIVASSHRCEGIGSHLVAVFLDEAVRQGCWVARTRTEAGGPAEAFWRRLGWLEEVRFEGYAHHRDFLALRRDLAL